MFRINAMKQLANGLHSAGHHTDSLSIRETELSTVRRLGVPVAQMLHVQTNIAATYQQMGLREKALSMQRDVYSGNLRLYGEEHEYTLTAASNYASSLTALKRFEEAKSLLRRSIPVARRVLGEGHDLTLRMMMIHASTLFMDPAATLDDLRQAVATFEEIERTARRVFGGAHPLVETIETSLRKARATLAARDV